jgi:hypothetical protein
VTTYHNDNYRTGWNNAETILTPAKVGGGTFNLLQSVALDDQVDAQPLVVPNQAISGQGTHNVVYVATESNSIYAIDASSGAVLLDVNLGSPVPYTSLPGSCNNNGPNVGINSTPVIDPTTEHDVCRHLHDGGGNQTFRIHALDLSTLTDKVPSVVISASAALMKGQTYNFDPTSSRQRAALLLSHGNGLCGLRELLRLQCEHIARLGAGLANEYAQAARRQSPEQHAHRIARQFLPDIDLDVGFRPRGRSRGRHFLCHGQFRSERHDLQPGPEPVRERGEAVVRTSKRSKAFSRRPRVTTTGRTSMPRTAISVRAACCCCRRKPARCRILAAHGQGRGSLSAGCRQSEPKQGRRLCAISRRCWCGESYFQNDKGHPM